jgi:hypothetical protein
VVTCVVPCNCQSLLGIGYLLRLVDQDGNSVKQGLKHGYDTRIKTILPEFELVDKEAMGNCVIRDVLSHRTGLPGY